MNLLLRRLSEGPDAGVHGVLTIPNFARVPYCFTLEPPRLFEGTPNVPAKTCIPPGTYDVEVYNSPHQKRRVPRLKDVPGRDEIEMHPFNQIKETKGCIAPGFRWLNPIFLAESRDAFGPLFLAVDGALEAGEEVTITITDEIPVAESPAPEVNL